MQSRKKRSDENKIPNGCIRSHDFVICLYGFANKPTGIVANSYTIPAAVHLDTTFCFQPHSCRDSNA